jgi:hypothetical protein
MEYDTDRHTALHVALDMMRVRQLAGLVNFGRDTSEHARQIVSDAKIIETYLKG